MYLKKNKITLLLLFVFLNFTEVNAQDCYFGRCRICNECMGVGDVKSGFDFHRPCGVKQVNEYFAESARKRKELLAKRKRIFNYNKNLSKKINWRNEKATIIKGMIKSSKEYKYTPAIVGATKSILKKFTTFQIIPQGGSSTKKGMFVLESKFKDENGEYTLVYTMSRYWVIEFKSNFTSNCEEKYLSYGWSLFNVPNLPTLLQITLNATNSKGNRRYSKNDCEKPFYTITNNKDSYSSSYQKYYSTQPQKHSSNYPEKRSILIEPFSQIGDRFTLPSKGDVSGFISFHLPISSLGNSIVRFDPILSSYLHNSYKVELEKNNIIDSEKWYNKFFYTHSNLLFYDFLVNKDQYSYDKVMEVLNYNKKMGKNPYFWEWDDEYVSPSEGQTKMTSVLDWVYRGKKDKTIEEKEERRNIPQSSADNDQSLQYKYNKEKKNGKTNVEALLDLLESKGAQRLYYADKKRRASTGSVAVTALTGKKITDEEYMRKEESVYALKFIESIKKGILTISPPKDSKSKNKSWQVKSILSGRFFEVTEKNGTWGCTCPAKKVFKGDCDHIKAKKREQQ